ncbi:hypothetical protein [Rhizobium rhizogenes]|uniref:hypothetical protein n=1 Tax=Rhizobium rhizogenes TaxID=359 RepID=UPI0015733184|nr:hypothetical protein [Rhizobium rhizogenes]NTF67935.1 hypothetical protein [Rhizobium rhizogenes]
MSITEVSGREENFSADISIISQEPLLEMIISYRQGLADFTANAPEDINGADAFAETSYRAPRRSLESWIGPACTFAGAIAALRMAMDADRNDDTEIVSSMVKAALGYFEAPI